jgi:hypothetical protein
VDYEPTHTKHLRAVNPLLDLRPKTWVLLILPHGMRAEMLRVAGYLAERGPLIVLDGGNSFNAHVVSRAVRGRQEILERIQVARAFTCHQMLSLLVTAPRQQAPTLILDLLTTFFDENVPLAERRYLLDGCIDRLNGLSATRPLAVSLRLPRIPGRDGESLINQLKEAAPQVLASEPEPAMPAPWRLF